MVPQIYEWEKNTQSKNYSTTDVKSKNILKILASN